LGILVAVLGDLLMNDGRPSRGLPSLKYGKDPTRNGGEIRGPILGFQITDNSYA